MSNKKTAVNVTAQKNEVKQSAHKTKLALNKLFNEENLSLNAVFKFLNGKGKTEVKNWLSEFNKEQTELGKPILLFTDLNVKFFLEAVKGKTKLYKGESIDLLPEKKTKFSASFVLDAFKIALR